MTEDSDEPFEQQTRTEKIGMSAQLPKSLTKKNRQTERRKNIPLLGVYKIPLLSLSIFHTISPLLCLSSSIILSLSKKHIHTHTHNGFTKT